MTATHRRSYMLILLAAILWGTTGTSQALAPDGFTPLMLGALRILIGGLVLVGVALLRGKFRTRRHWSLPVVLLGAMSIALYQPTFFEGTRRTGVAVGTIVAIGSSPVFAGLLQWVWHKQRPDATWLVATLLAVTGSIILTSAEQDLQLDLAGIGFALTAGLSYVLYATAIHRLTQTHPPEEVVAVVFCAGAVLLFPFLLGANLAPVFTLRGLIVIFHLGVLATGLSYVFFGLGMRVVPVSSATTLSLMEPLTAATLGILVLRESFNFLQGIGMLLVLGGLLVLALRPAPPHYSPDRQP